MDRRRVVVTGMGILCPIGNDVPSAWQNLNAGKCGIQTIQRFDPCDLTVRIAGEVRDFDARALFGNKEARRMDRVTQLAMAATLQALEQARLDMSAEDPYEVGCLIGSGVGGIETLLEGARIGNEKGLKFVSPLLVPMMLTDSPVGRVAIEFNFRGPNMSISTACATGNNAIGEAAEMIRRGAADVMICGSTEAAIVPLAVASFANMGALSSRNDDPATASRPFDRDRDGFVIAEGAAILVLEGLDHALRRGAPILAELLGYATTDDAYHVTAPMENGEGAQAAMRKALRNANLTINDIDYINAHGTSTPLNDAAETRAIKAVFGERAYSLKISSVKGATGHMLGAAGSVEAVFSVQSLLHDFVPPTINYHTPDPECDLDYTPNQGVARTVRYVMSNSFGFGGHNAVLIFGKYTGNGS
ncbi:MAG: beta-ketoacyl-[acyl-carrier-protein] synthase II [Candidatus Thermofonsia Clade 1 bacterium]|uniref:3-oxoacyl-[acyl-carrier-protein] synthase 2 n=1 Tax=Candidatus Thermofonsia Clade 1 bacterium TaxID=2364210 RepID=A0A2M8P1N7_9CHLR|nr:MAG: beta-ketoacyl-[acyl-carrier-protein] synthase II [Candidatus Thermofonsia Clade 1 bacterium]